MDLAAARTMVRVLDDYGVDPILGFFLPGVGDLIGAVLGIYLLIVAGQRKVAPIVMARMLLNLTIDLTVGVLPIVGDVADVVFRANKKNLALLEQRVDGGGRGSWRDWLAVLGAGALCLAALAGVVWLAIKLLAWIF